MTADRVSQITWDAWDRRAWDAAYRDARRIHAARLVRDAGETLRMVDSLVSRSIRDARMVDAAFSTTR